MLLNTKLFVKYQDRFLKLSTEVESASIFDNMLFTEHLKFNKNVPLRPAPVPPRYAARKTLIPTPSNTKKRWIHRADPLRTPEVRFCDRDNSRS